MMAMISLGSRCSILVTEPLKTYELRKEFSVYLSVGAYEIAGLTEDSAEWRQGDSEGLWKDRESPSTCSSSPCSAHSSPKGPLRQEALLSTTDATSLGLAHGCLSLPVATALMRHSPFFLILFQLFTLRPAWPLK